MSVLTGRQVCDAASRMGVPAKEALEAHYEAIQSQDTPMDYVTEDMREGFTGVIGILRCGDGPVAALRFDIDALPMTENSTTEHRPTREGFASKNPGCMHACGHDSHIAMGLGTAKVLSEIREHLTGTVKLIFQPGEEGARGAKSIAAAGHLRMWITLPEPTSPRMIPLMTGTSPPAPTAPLPPPSWTSRLRARLLMRGLPEKGRSALLAAAHAAVGLAGIPRHSGGMSRINVGTLQAGSGRNVIPDHAFMQVEVRGETTEINTYMEEQAARSAKARL